MRKNLYTLIGILLLIGCGSEHSENTMVVKGNVKGLKKGTLYLQHIADSTLASIDSLRVEGNGQFSFKTELESPEVFYLYLKKEDANDINDRITFFGEPGTITINTEWNTFDFNPQIEGSKTQEKLEEYQKTMSRFNMKNLELVRTAANPELNLDSLQLDSIQNLSERNIKRGYAFAVNYALNNKDSYIAPYIAITEIADANVMYLDSIYGSLSAEVSESKYGRALKAHLSTIKKQ